MSCATPILLSGPLGHVPETAGHVAEIVGHDPETAGHLHPKYAHIFGRYLTGWVSLTLSVRLTTTLIANRLGLFGRTVAVSDKSWEGNGVDAVATIAAIAVEEPMSHCN